MNQLPSDAAASSLPGWPPQIIRFRTATSAMTARITKTSFTSKAGFDACLTASGTKRSVPVSAVSASPVHGSQNVFCSDSSRIPGAMPSRRRSIAELNPTTVLRPSVLKEQDEGYP